MAGSPTPTTWRVAQAGLASGPRKLNIVATPSSRRTGAAKRIAGWKRGAKQKADPGLVDAPANTLGAEVDDDAEGLEHVGRPGERRRCTAAVLADDRPGAGDDEGAESRDVDRAAAVPAGPAGVDDLDADLEALAVGRASRGRGRSSPRRSRPWCAAPPRRPRSGPASPRPSSTSSRAAAASSVGQVLAARGSSPRIGRPSADRSRGRSPSPASVPPEVAVEHASAR